MGCARCCARRAAWLRCVGCWSGGRRSCACWSTSCRYVGSHLRHSRCPRLYACVCARACRATQVAAPPTSVPIAGIDDLRVRPRPDSLSFVDSACPAQSTGDASNKARAELESIGSEYGYKTTWTFSPRAGRDGLVVLTHESLGPHTTVTEPQLDCGECTAERRLLCVSMPDLTVVCVYAPNSGREGRLTFRIDQWEPSVRTYVKRLRTDCSADLYDGGADRRAKPLIYLGDLNVAHDRDLDCWGTTDSQWGNWKASGRTREEASALDLMLSECDLVDGFRHFHPSTKSGTCWAQKAATVPVEAQREHWKRYDYALITPDLLGTADTDAAPAGLRVEEVQHLADAFVGGRPDHLPVQVVVAPGVLAAGSATGLRSPAKKRARARATTTRRVRALSKTPR